MSYTGGQNTLQRNHCLQWVHSALVCSKLLLMSLCRSTKGTAHQPRVIQLLCYSRSFPRAFFSKCSLFSWILYKVKCSQFSFQISLWSLVNGMRILTSQERHFSVFNVYNIYIKTTKLPKSKETISFFIGYLRNNFYVKVVCFHKV